MNAHGLISLSSEEPLHAAVARMIPQDIFRLSDYGMEGSNLALEEAVEKLLNQKIHPIILGGEWKPRSGSWIYFGAEMPKGERLAGAYFGIQRRMSEAMGIFFADEYHAGGSDMALDVVEDVVAHAEEVFVSIDLDVFAAPFAPGVKEPQILGLLPWDVIPVVERLGRTDKVKGFHIMGLVPSKDKDGLTAQLGATLILHFLRAVSLCHCYRS